jgi:hypothetical protein
MAQKRFSEQNLRDVLLKKGSTLLVCHESTIVRDGGLV